LFPVPVVVVAVALLVTLLALYHAGLLVAVLVRQEEVSALRLHVDV
jgi:hypothetical protein